jgi:2-haloacid dehalogenase
MDAQLQTRPFPEVAEALRRLGERRLAIISNGHPQALKALCRSAGFLSHFEQIVSADDVQIYKPARAVYQLATDRLSVAQDRLLFVSSNAWDVAGASHSKLRTAWVNRTGAPAEQLGPTPEMVVKDLLELAERLT